MPALQLAPKQALLQELGLLSVRALGTTRDAEVSPLSGDRVCESDIYRGGREGRRIGPRGRRTPWR